MIVSLDLPGAIVSLIVVSTTTESCGMESAGSTGSWANAAVERIVKLMQSQNVFIAQQSTFTCFSPIFTGNTVVGSGTNSPSR